MCKSSYIALNMLNPTKKKIAFSFLLEFLGGVFERLNKLEKKYTKYIEHWDKYLEEFISYIVLSHSLLDCQRKF